MSEPTRCYRSDCDEPAFAALPEPVCIVHLFVVLREQARPPGLAEATLELADARKELRRLIDDDDALIQLSDHQAGPAWVALERYCAALERKRSLSR
jgi:hypothetical protein